MADKIDVVEEEVTNVTKDFLKGLRRIVMAGVGAVSLAQEEVEGFVNKLVDRGEIAEKDGRKLMDDFMEKRKNRAEESKKRVESEIDQRMEGLLNRMSIPTRKDIETLSKKVSDLAEKVDELKKKG